MKYLKYSLPGIILFLSIIIPNQSCKKETPAEAIATFVMGDVKLLRLNEGPRQLKLGDRIVARDTIKTGRNSLFAFQVAESAVIRITANTTILITDLLTGKSNKVVLNRGRVITSVKKLWKNSTYEVQTYTMVAAVRGTEFSVSYGRGKSVVAVNEGAVNVQRVSGETATGKEKIVQEGTAAVVTGTSTRIRPVNRKEKEEFARIEKISMIKDVHKKSESDLKEIEKRVLQSEEVKEDRKVEKKKILEKDPAEKDPAEKDPAQYVDTSKTDGDTLIWTSQKVYKTGDSVIVRFKNMPESKYCWISVAKAGATGRDYCSYNWTYSKTEGEIVFEDLGLEPGDYEARAHFSRKNDISKSFSFVVK